jgi:hypothetical protein
MKVQAHRAQMELGALSGKARLKFFPYLVLEGPYFGLYSTVNSAKISKFRGGMCPNQPAGECF